ncbi:MAG: hypothetical protein A3H49_06930 [Nitrospirae bacterium RIFCSPLOWO2_02_FULL_62_14]|nr:MAG: hypothetical protein A3H49_06930 [Nitrospirae bacterium RIFCSPLOWO2_02_FULL_62_14]
MKRYTAIASFLKPNTQLLSRRLKRKFLLAVNSAHAQHVDILPHWWTKSKNLFVRRNVESVVRVILSYVWPVPNAIKFQMLMIS